MSFIPFVPTQVTLSTEALAPLARLTQLTELELNNFNIDLALEGTIQPFPYMRVLSFSNISMRGEDFVDVHFCRTLSDMFPNLHMLNVGFGNEVK